MARPAEAPAPRHAFLNLTTAVHGLGFSPDGAMLALSSRDAKNALRIAHLDSCTIFENWPTRVSKPVACVLCASKMVLSLAAFVWVVSEPGTTCQQPAGYTEISLSSPLGTACHPARLPTGC